MFRKSLQIIIFLFLYITAKANVHDSTLINQLIKEIEREQIATRGQFLPGMFYSYRKFSGYPQRFTDDENIFFTAILSFALKNMLPWLSTNNRETAEGIIAKAVKAYPYFQNRKGLPIYYFWQRGYPIMPHSYWASRSGKKLAVSEDIDDTVMILMTSEAHDTTLKQVKQIMDSASNGQRRRINTTYKKYQSLPAHTTYMGKNMLMDFDFSVQCNVIYFLLDRKIPLNEKDSATIFLLQQIVKNREYIKDPVYVSPYYVHASILLYHLARLMGRFEIAELEPYRQQVIADIRAALQTSENIMEDIILSTSLLRLGADVSPLPIESMEQFGNSNQGQFVFYQARAAILFRNPFKRMFLNFSMFNYHYFCPAYNKALLLEYLVERSRKSETGKVGSDKGDVRSALN